MILQAQQLATDLAAWLVKGVSIDPALAAIFAVVFGVLWLATMRHGDSEPPRCSDGE